ncbi:hypothetical protein [Mucilaginibacter sp.]|uniref:hypothetical protein n=1 Tax=Mucilaginibacter sp. TaxID=1882438 RepID=UPI003D132B9E
MVNFFKQLFSAGRKEESSEAILLLEGYDTFETARKLELEENMEEALKYYDIAINGGLNRALSPQAFILQKLDYDFEAIEAFTKAISNSPKDSNIFFGRHLSKSKIGDIEGAIEDIKQAILLSKTNSHLNREYDTEVQKLGYPNIETFYKTYLLNVEMDIDLTMQQREKLKAKRKYRS